MQNKIIVRYHYTPIQMAKIKMVEIVSVYKDVEQLELSTIADGNVSDTIT